MVTHGDSETPVRALILEDDPTQLETLVELVEDEGLVAVSCSRGRDALARLQQGDISVAVVDLRLPDIGDAELLEELATYADRVSVIINTGFSSYESASAAVNLGAFAYVEKGTKPERLIGHLHRALKEVYQRRSQELERNLVQTRQGLELAVRSANVGLWDWNVLTGQIFFSPEWKGQLGYRDDELKGTYEEWESHLHPDDHDSTIQALQAYLDGNAAEYAVEFRLRHKDGSYRWVFARGEAFRDPSGQPRRMLGCHLDITERKQLEEQLRHTQKMEAVGQLAAGVAHEFNNLLFGILGSAELILATKEGELPEHFERPLRDIKKCGRRGAALTKQLLSFARKKTPEVSHFDINQVVIELHSVIQRMITETITLETDFASDLPPVKADRGEIEQAVINLARNARDAMPEGGSLTIRTATEQLDEARVSTYPHAPPGVYVQLSVADTGCGMAPDTKRRIFELFFTTKPVGKGTGLGLSTVFADVTRSGGIIEVESQQGEGTVFHIYLPSAEQTFDAGSDDSERSADPFPGGSETILVVDDDEVVLDSAAYLLEMRGYTVLRALGVLEALEAAASHDGTIDLLLTDVTMPEMNGWELSQKLIAKRPDMEVIFMSGYAQDVLKAGATEGEHIEFLEKPPEGDTLFRRIREVLDASRRSAPKNGRILVVDDDEVVRIAIRERLEGDG